MKTIGLRMETVDVSEVGKWRKRNVLESYSRGRGQLRRHWHKRVKQEM